MDRPIQILEGSTMLFASQLDEGDPSKALQCLIKDIVGATDSLSGCIYYLSFSRSQFRVECQSGRQGEAPTLDFGALDPERRMSSHSGPASLLLEKVVTSGEAHVIDGLSGRTQNCWHHPDAHSLVGIPIQREGNCIGMIELDGLTADHFNESRLNIIHSATALARLLFEKAEALTLLESLQQPINFHLPFKEFVERQVELAVFATDMPYVALREWDQDDTLECLGAYGFNGLSLEQLTLTRLDRFPYFLKALTQQHASTVNNIYDEDVDAIGSRPELDKIRSYMVAPILVGDDAVFGTLSCAAECPYNYSQLERRGLETIANAIGVAILNYRNANARSDDVAEFTKLGAAMTSVEVAQAARHEARNALAQASSHLTLINRECNKDGKIDRDAVRESITAIVDRHGEADRSLDKIKQVTRPPERELKIVSINDLWKHAFDVVNGRLDELRISATVIGREVSTEVFPDYLAHAFLNLALNSIDAFREQRRRRDRTIKVYIDAQSENANSIKIKYVDNATGLDLPKLRPRPTTEVLEAKDIFKAGVTGKADGSGFGLYLVRSILIEHKGSIELIDGRNGATFELHISKHLKSNRK